jgi:hypothetical protein
MKDVIEFLKNEWSVLSAAPFTFISFFVLSLGTTFLLARWRYEGIVETNKERIESLKERLESKDELLDDYRQRLHLIPASGSAFSQLSNWDLKQRALNTVAQIRAFLEEIRLNDTLLTTNRPRYEGMTEEEKDMAWQQETTKLLLESVKANSQYDSKFKVDTILLRDELLSRLPTEAKNEMEYRTYEHPTNPIGMGIVADDLERLAKSIPDSKN